MRIVDRTAFLAMPPLTVYAKYEPCIVGPLMVKGDTCGVLPPDGVGDWTYATFENPINGGSDELFHNFAAMERGSSYPLETFDDCVGRDGLFDKDQLFVIYERDDLLKMVDLLTRAAAIA